MNKKLVSQYSTPETIINFSIVFYAFCLPISKAGVIFFEVLMIVSWLLTLNFRDKFYQLKDNKFVFVLSVFILFSAIAILWSEDISFAINYVRKYWHFLIVPVIITSLKKEYIQYIFSAFLLGMLISEITSYGIFLELWTKEGISPDDPSPFMDHTNYSIYLAFTVFILMHRIFYEDSIKWKLIYGIYMFFSMCNLFINGGRTGQVAFFIALIVVGLLNIQSKTKAVLLSIIVGSFIFITAYSISPVFKARMNYTYEETSNMVLKSDFSGAFSMRVSLWILGVNKFIESPIIGSGIGDEGIDIKILANKFNFDVYKNFDEPYIDYHNAFIQYAVQLGIIGLCLFILLVRCLFQLKFKSVGYRNLNTVFICLFILLSFIGLSLHIMASMVLIALFASVFNVISRYETTLNVALYPSDK